MPTLDLNANIIDVRDIIARLEEIENERDSFVIGSPDGEETPAPEQWKEENIEDAAELSMLAKIMGELKGYGGDEQWRGDWYPLTLIADSHFEDYAKELAEDTGAVNKDLSWPNNCIDWEQAATELQQDYGSLEIDGNDYWYR